MFSWVNIHLNIIKITLIVAGVFLLNRKPRIVPGNMLMLFGGLLMLPGPILMLIPMISGEMPFYSLSIVPLIITGILFFVVRKACSCRLMIYNAEEDVIFNAVLQALSQHNIEYQERYGKIFLPSLNSELKILCNNGIASIDSKTPDLINTLTPDIERQLNNTQYPKVPFTGIVFLVMGLLLLIQAISLNTLFIR